MSEYYDGSGKEPFVHAETADRVRRAADPDPILQAAVEAFMTECRKYPVESRWPAGMQHLAGWDLSKAIQLVIDTVRPSIEQRAFSEFADRIEQLPTAGSQPTAAFIRLLRDQAGE